MSKSALDAFRAKLEGGQALRDEFTRAVSAGGSKATASIDDVVAFAKMRGFEFSPSDLLSGTELSDEMLDAIAAGAGTQFDCSELVQWANSPGTAPLRVSATKDYYRRG